MSERIDWIRVAVMAAWSAGVGYQASTAICDWWTNPRIDGNEEAVALQNILNRERRLFNWGRIRNGAKIDGWKWCDFGSISDSSWRPMFRLLHPLWPKGGSDAIVDTSVLVSMKQERSSTNGKRENIYIIRRYSLIAPSVHDDIIQFVHGKWSPTFQSYISENVVAIGWQRHWSNVIRIVLVEVQSKTYQLLEMISPGHYSDIRAMFEVPIGGHLMVLYRVEDGNGRITFRLVEYEISPSESFRSPIVQQVASRQLAWPIRNWDVYPTIGGSLTFLGVFDLMAMPFENVAARVISFDRYGFHDLDDEDEWITKFNRIAIGLRIAETKRSLVKSLPFRFIDGFVLHRSHLFARIAHDSKFVFVHRPLSPPSEKYLAAEEFCMANPGFDFADLKNQSVCDMFGGIFDGKKPAVIKME